MNIIINGITFEVTDQDGDLLLMSPDKDLLIPNGWVELLNEAESQCEEFEGRDHEENDVVSIDHQAAKQMAWDAAEGYILDNIDKAIEVVY